jgi:2-polyprenyl-6-methoxyphenol hydroxylase-like FAD-dependent oxidoreductase
LTSLLGGYDCDFSSTPSGWMTMPEVRQQWSVPRVEGVLYVGDALETIEPLAGQGLAMALAGASLAAEMLLAGPRPRIDAAWQQRYASIWRGRFRRTIDRAQRLGWLLRRPALLHSLASLPPAPKRLQQLLLHACYRSTRLPA